MYCTSFLSFICILIKHEERERVITIKIPVCPVVKQQKQFRAVYLTCFLAYINFAEEARQTIYTSKFMFTDIRAGQ